MNFGRQTQADFRADDFAEKSCLFVQRFCQTDSRRRFNRQTEIYALQYEKSGEILTSITETGGQSKKSFGTLPRWKQSAKIWRICSPTRS